MSAVKTAGDASEIVTCPGTEYAFPRCTMTWCVVLIGTSKGITPLI